MSSRKFSRQKNTLETILEVPIPEEMFNSMGIYEAFPWKNMRPLMGFKSAVEKSDDEFMALLRLVMSPLIPIPVQLDHVPTLPIMDIPIESSMAKYIVRQYIAATGGALDWVERMVATGSVKLVASDMHQRDDNMHGGSNSQIGGFVIWQENPNMWSLQMVLDDFMVNTGSDGMVAWYQTSSQPHLAARGPRSPLRRFFQGLDPRFTASLFSNALCTGEKSINGQNCFTLKVETAPSTLEAQSSPTIEIISHSIWGYFSQRTGLLVQFEDTMLLKVKDFERNDTMYWGTSMVSVMEDYKFFDNVNIALRGKTTTELCGYGEAHNHKWKIEESWEIGQVHFDFPELTMEFFLPPELEREHDEEEQHDI